MMRKMVVMLSFLCSLGFLFITDSAFAGQGKVVPEYIRQLVFDKSGFSQPIILQLPCEDDPGWKERILGYTGGLPPISIRREYDMDKIVLFFLTNNGFAKLEKFASIGNIEYDFLSYSDTIKPYIINKETYEYGKCRGSFRILLVNRILKSIDYTNQYEASPGGVKVKYYALTFTYTLKEKLPGLPKITRQYEGKAKAYLDPDDGKWKLENLSLSDNGIGEYSGILKKQYEEYEAKRIAAEKAEREKREAIERAGREKRMKEVVENFEKGMVLVKGGCFQMGDTFGDGDEDEKPVHEVCVDDFYMGKYEVTQIQWEAIMGNNPSKFKGCDDCPVENISWDDVQEYISKLNSKSGKSYRLPTEAEWEYAARSGGKNEKYSGGNDLDSVGWYDGNSGSKTHPVGQKEANGLGLYDMSGNVWEWCQDWYDKNYYRSSSRNNPQGASSGQSRVLRGGSWVYKLRDLRASLRGIDTSDYRIYGSGFRLVRTK